MKQNDILRATIVAGIFLLTFGVLVIDANIFRLDTKLIATAYILFITLVVNSII
jgi:hypothetical protein